MSDRAERREEIKLRLEYAKLGISVIGILALVFGIFQWMGEWYYQYYVDYERMATEWRNHTRTLVDNPGWRPYFEGNMELTVDDPNREAVLAVADIRLDVMEAMLMRLEILRGSLGTRGKPIRDWPMRDWKNTFASAFRTSPALCARLHDTAANYLLIVPLGQRVCGNSSEREGSRSTAAFA